MAGVVGGEVKRRYEGGGVMLQSLPKPADGAAAAEIGRERLGGGCLEFCLGHCGFRLRDGPWEAPQ